MGETGWVDGEVRLEPYSPRYRDGFASLVSGVLAEHGFFVDPRLDADLGRPEEFYDAVWLALDGDQVVGSAAIRRLSTAALDGATGLDGVEGWDGVAGQDGVESQDGVEGEPTGGAELKRMYLLPSYRRQGLGGRLLKLALEWARSQRLGTVRLDTGTAMTEAQCFYESAGFERCGARTEVGVTDARCEVLYRLKL